MAPSGLSVYTILSACKPSQEKIVDIADLYICLRKYEKADNRIFHLRVIGFAFVRPALG